MEVKFDIGVDVDDVLINYKEGMMQALMAQGYRYKTKELVDELEQTYYEDKSTPTVQSLGGKSWCKKCIDQGSFVYHNSDKAREKNVIHALQELQKQGYKICIITAATERPERNQMIASLFGNIPVYYEKEKHKIPCHVYLDDDQSKVMNYLKFTNGHIFMPYRVGNILFPEAPRVYRYHANTESKELVTEIKRQIEKRKGKEKR